MSVFEPVCLPMPQSSNSSMSEVQPSGRFRALDIDFRRSPKNACMYVNSSRHASCFAY